MNARLLLLAPLLVAFVSPLALEEEIRFTPKEGAALTVNYSTSLEMSQEDQQVTVTLNGEEQDQESPDIGLEITQSFDGVFQDKVIGSEDGRVTKLRRTFEAIGQERAQTASTPEGDQSNDQTGESDLEGLAVVYTWDADEGGYSVAFDEDSEGDEELLEELEFDIYFLGLLPPGAVSVGDTWEADVAALNHINDPSGDLQISWDGEEDADDEDDVGQQYEDNLEGTISCKFAEIVEEDGARIALIEVTVEASTSSSKGDEIDNEGVTGTISEDVTISFDFQGVLRWNLDAGHPMGLELGGGISYVIDSTQDLARDSETFMLEMQRSFEGSNRISCTVSSGGSEE